MQTEVPVEYTDIENPKKKRQSRKWTWIIPKKRQIHSISQDREENRYNEWNCEKKNIEDQYVKR